MADSTYSTESLPDSTYHRQLDWVSELARDSLDIADLTPRWYSANCLQISERRQLRAASRH